LEPLGVVTVGDLAAIDPVRLNRLAGVAEATRREVKAWAKAWRKRFDGAATAVRARSSNGDALPDPEYAVGLLSDCAGGHRARAKRRAAELLLGMEGDLDAFASQAELAEALGVSRARGSQLIQALQDAWALNRESCILLDTFVGLVRDAMAALGGVATVEELAGDLLAQLSPSADGQRPERMAAGLVRVALERVDALARADGLDPDQPRLVTRRRGGRVALLATEPLLFDAAVAAARRADVLVADAEQAGEVVVPRQRVGSGLVEAAAVVAPDAPGLTGDRLARLAARLSRRAAVSGHGELYDRQLPLATALGRALSGLGAREEVAAQEVRDRVRARFPTLPSLPERPLLDELVQAAGLPLVYDEQRRRYRAKEAPPDTTGLVTLPPSQGGATADPEAPDGGAAGQRLRESARARSFLALGVDALRVDRALDLLAHRHQVAVVDVTRVLVEALRARAAEAGVPWELVRAADAAQPGTRDARGLAALVEQAVPAVADAVTAAETGAPDGVRPVVLTELSPLARYGHLAVLARWSDLAARRRQAIWAVVPQLINNHGPLVDGRPLPLAAPGQFVRIDADWLAAARPTAVAEGAAA
jgi:hypothetical protein